LLSGPCPGNQENLAIAAIGGVVALGLENLQPQSLPFRGCGLLLRFRGTLSDRALSTEVWDHPEGLNATTLPGLRRGKLENESADAGVLQRDDGIHYRMGLCLGTAQHNLFGLVGAVGHNRHEPIRRPVLVLLGLSDLDNRGRDFGNLMLNRSSRRPSRGKSLPPK
jgi:hypothetical protein